MAPRRPVSTLQRRASFSAMQSPAFRVAIACKVGMTLDALAVLCVASLAFFFGYSKSIEVAVLHMMVLFFRGMLRAVVAFAYILCPHWFTPARLCAMFFSSAIVSALIFVGCASATVFVTLGFSTPYVAPRLDIDGKGMVAEALMYFVANALLASIMWIQRPAFDEHSHGSRRIPADLLTLKDITLHTFVLDECKASANPLDDDASDRSLCCICLSAMSPGEMISELSCHHRYHASCLDTWDAHQQTQQRSTLCPLRCSLTSAKGRDAFPV
eukprot:TRINITY_DN21819_c0_g2_i1.p1 TRINITY_DN21819_c0_g2~~TRINITY_DN21819_c0_g2_i1.p1  ORF type:complete len:271 (+),score=18.24 TRINITY_DN21819_c0_g2_i1:155-967(+)